MRELSRVVMAAKLLADSAREEGAAAKEQLVSRMADEGVERARVHGDGGEDFGTVVLTSGRVEARLVDEAAFTAWVQERYPEEVTPQVRRPFRDRLLAHAARAGDPVDEQGELVPGVVVMAGDPYLMTRPSREAKDRMRSALAANGLLSLGGSGRPDGAVA